VRVSDGLVSELRALDWEKPQAADVARLAWPILCSLIQYADELVLSPPRHRPGVLRDLAASLAELDDLDLLGPPRKPRR
jgi:hypothetical protein